VLDWSSPGFVRGFFVDVLWSFSKQVLQSWLYYLMSTLTDDISELTRYTGILRGVESFGQAVSYGLNATAKVNSWVPIGINLAMLVLCLYPTWLVVRDINPPEDNELAAVVAARQDPEKSESPRESTDDEKVSDGVQPEQLMKVATREQ